MTRIYYTAVDNGDGSLGVEFFESQECINLLEDNYPEYYRGEGGGYFDVEGSFDKHIISIREVKADIYEYNTNDK